MPSFKYPKPQVYEGGCKVGWNYYYSKADADEAAEVALKEANYREDHGYDFGMCSPGSIINHVRDGVPMFRVCIP